MESPYLHFPISDTLLHRHNPVLQSTCCKSEIGLAVSGSIWPQRTFSHCPGNLRHLGPQGSCPELWRIVHFEWGCWKIVCRPSPSHTDRWFPGPTSVSAPPTPRICNSLVKTDVSLKWRFPAILCSMFLVVPFLVPFRSVPLCWFVPSLGLSK